jgi:hypothetical protein
MLREEEREKAMLVETKQALAQMELEAEEEEERAC